MNVAAFLARRLILALPVLVGVTAITYFTMAASAGDYIPGLSLDAHVRPEDIARMRENLGLDRPVVVQYVTWLAGIVQGNFGLSMIDGTPIITHIAQRLPNTLELAIAAMLIGIPVGVTIGVVSALRRGSALDSLLSTLAVAGFAIPQFWLGIVLILVFAVGFRGWGLPALPAGGAYDPVFGGDPLDRLAHLVLPAATLSLLYISIWSRYARSSMLNVIAKDYVRTARAKGIPELQVVLRHELRNAVTPLITLIGLELPRLVSGTLVIEVIYAWPGIGRFTYERALSYDYTAVMGVTTFAAVMVIVGSILADFLYSVANPQIAVG